MSPPADKRAYRIAVWIAASCVLAYALLFGPFLFLDRWLGLGTINNETLILTVWRPHFALSYYSKSYFGYLGWWAALSGITTPKPHDSFRADYEYLVQGRGAGP